MIRIALALILAASPVSAQDGAELALAKRVLAELNPISIRENREFCGYIGFDAAGRLTFSQPARGDLESCEPNDPDELKVIVASYHTHAAYAPDYYNELPSAEDVEGDEAEGIDGYVATPGGRLWYIDTGDMVISQICGIGCLPKDPDFVAGDLGIIAPSYEYDELVIKLEE